MRYILSAAIFLGAGLSGFAQNIDLLGKLYYPDGLNDIWGYTDTAGVEFALVGVNTGISIVDITTDSLHPREVFKVPGPYSDWGDVKTWDGFAYAVNEKDSGLLIIDLRFLPDSIHYQRWHGPVDSLTFKSAHNIWIDENGVGYLYGTNLVNKGTYFLDLTTPDRYNPTVLGKYTDHYIHDGFVRGDTLWASHISDGFQSVIDVSDKQNPVVLGTMITPNAFTHNCALTNDGQYLFTTDERSGAFVTAYDVSDVTAMTEVDRYQSNPTSGIIPHNAYWINSYLAISYYRDGVVLLDVKHPYNMIEIGRFDSSPFPSGPGYEGNWGAYPYFPSGKMVMSDRMEGLFVLRPQYKRAAYLEGEVSDTLSGLPVIGAQIDIPLTPALEHTGLIGQYATGLPDAGFYTVRFSKSGCLTKYATVELFPDSIVTLDMELSCQPPIGIGRHDLSNLTIGQAGRVLSIQSLANPANMQLELFNLSGQMVWASRLTDAGTETVQVPSEIASGLYMLKMSEPSATVVRKIMIP